MITKIGINIGSAGSALGFAMNFGMPAYDFMSGNRSLGGTIGDAIGGSTGYKAGNVLGNSIANGFLKNPNGKIGSAIRFASGLVGSGVGTTVVGGIGDKLIPYQRGIDQQQQKQQNQQSQQYWQTYVNPDMTKTSAVQIPTLLRKIPKYVLPKEEISFVKEHGKAALGVAGGALLAGGYLGNRSFKNRDNSSFTNIMQPKKK